MSQQAKLLMVAALVIFSGLFGAREVTLVHPEFAGREKLSARQLARRFENYTEKMALAKEAELAGAKTATTEEPVGETEMPVSTDETDEVLAQTETVLPTPEPNSEPEAASIPLVEVAVAPIAKETPPAPVPTPQPTPLTYLLDFLIGPTVYFQSEDLLLQMVVTGRMSSIERVAFEKELNNRCLIFAGESKDRCPKWIEFKIPRERVFSENPPKFVLTCPDEQCIEKSFAVSGFVVEPFEEKRAYTRLLAHTGTATKIQNARASAANEPSRIGKVRMMSVAK